MAPNRPLYSNADIPIAFNHNETDSNKQSTTPPFPCVSKTAACPPLRNHPFVTYDSFQLPLGTTSESEGLGGGKKIVKKIDGLDVADEPEAPPLR